MGRDVELKDIVIVVYAERLYIYVELQKLDEHTGRILLGGEDAVDGEGFEYRAVHIV